MKKILKGFNNKFVINLFKSLGIFCTLMATSSCSDKMVNKLNRGNEKMLPSRSLKNVKRRVVSVGNRSLKPKSYYELTKADCERLEIIEMQKKIIESYMRDLNYWVEDFFYNFSVLDESFYFYCYRCEDDLKDIYKYCKAIYTVLESIEKANGSISARHTVLHIEWYIGFIKNTVEQKIFKIREIFKSREFNAREKELGRYEDLYYAYCKLVKKFINGFYQLDLLIEKGEKIY